MLEYVQILLRRIERDRAIECTLLTFLPDEFRTLVSEVQASMRYREGTSSSGIVHEVYIAGPSGRLCLCIPRAAGPTGTTLHPHPLYPEARLPFGREPRFERAESGTTGAGQSEDCDAAATAENSLPNSQHFSWVPRFPQDSDTDAD